LPCETGATCSFIHRDELAFSTWTAFAIPRIAPRSIRSP
jgi:hypothetical protein